ncbi:hypothetical protein [Planctomicrobium sp. SH527]|uniref:hypothetical protein n=1 Tax=Planctomicrobium sp. SH527 TaxID=3448123 RepID=UPI003F5BBE39
MKRRPASASMSLFSYLDGLVCTMGALILLLLMTAQRMRDQVLETYNQTQIVDVTEVEPLPAPPPTLMPVPGPSNDEVAAREAQIAEEIAAHQRAVAAHEAELKSKHTEWNGKLESLSDLTNRIAKEVEQARQRIQDNSAEVEQIERERAQLTTLMAMATEKNGQARSTEAELHQQAENLLRIREENLKKVEAAKVQKALRNPVFEIETSDGRSGTQRRPILIECTADSLTFVSEKISISAAMLNEFPPEYNPLLAGTEALQAYWTAYDKQQGKQGSKPYVLMIVRPGGTVGYYVARKFLEKIDEDFGYELVSATAEFKWPDADPGAVEACQNAIDRIMKGNRPLPLPPGQSLGMRGQKQQSLSANRGSSNEPQEGSGGQRPGTEKIVGSEGEFSLAEVDQLRNARASDSIGMLGPEWSNPRRRQLSAANNRPQQSTGDSASEQSALSEIESQMRQQRGMGQQGANRLQPGRNSGPGMAQAPEAQADRGLDLTKLPEGSPTGTEDSANNGSPAPFQQPGGQQQSGGSSSMMSPQPPGEKQLPPPPLAQMPERSRQLKNDGGAQRQWGRGKSNGAIGIERTMTVQLYPDRITIEQGLVTGIDSKMSRAELQESIAAIIESQAQTWGEPPSSFFWRPSFKIQIHPGGHPHYPKVKELFDHWALTYKHEYVSN